MDDNYRYFQYRTIDKHLIESLVNRELYFAKPNTLNDPFDCRLDLRKSFSRAVSLTTGTRMDVLLAALDSPKLLENWETKFSGVGVCSFSLCSDETLLWSHYADDHKGVCLLYQFSKSFLAEPANGIIGVSETVYENDALTEWLKNEPLDPSDTETLGKKLTEIYLTAKSPAWGYEKEARIIRFEPGILSIPTGCLDQVCFGLHTPQADIDLVTKLATNHCGVEKFCRMIRDESDFGIRMEAMPSVPLPSKPIAADFYEVDP